MRTNVHFPLKTNRMKRTDLDDFVACFKPENRQQRRATWSEESPAGRWRDFDYQDLVARDKCSLDLFWLKDESLLDADSLPDPHVIADEIAVEKDENADVAEAVRQRLRWVARFAHVPASAPMRNERDPTV